MLDKFMSILRSISFLNRSGLIFYSGLMVIFYSITFVLQFLIVVLKGLTGEFSLMDVLEAAATLSYIVVGASYITVLSENEVKS